MKSQKLLEQIMLLDNISDIKIYRINDNTSELINYNIQNSLNYIVKESYENNLQTNKTGYLFL